MARRHRFGLHYPRKNTVGDVVQSSCLSQKSRIKGEIMKLANMHEGDERKNERTLTNQPPSRLTQNLRLSWARIKYIFVSIKLYCQKKIPIVGSFAWGSTKTTTNPKTNAERNLDNPLKRQGKFVLIRFYHFGYPSVQGRRSSPIFGRVLFTRMNVKSATLRYAVKTLGVKLKHGWLTVNWMRMILKCTLLEYDSICAAIIFHF